jgi:hypothetical protein
MERLSVKPQVTILTILLGLCAAIPSVEAAAQEPAADTTAQAVSVFLDCNAPNCDFDHFRREITWVNWVRDREDADLHLLITVERTGGGGWYYTLDYLGRRAFAGLDKSLSYVSDPDDTDPEVRDGLTQTMGLGLVQYVEATPLAPRLRVVYEEPEIAVVERAEEDPWNLWVFEVSLDGSLESEKRESSYSISGEVEADRVAEDMKINFELSGRYRRDKFEFEDGQVEVYTSEDHSADLLIVWSLTDHWSAGGGAYAFRSTYLNRDLGAGLGAALEYNIFPYQESTRRQLTFRYTIEAEYFNYEEETVENKTEEILPRHSLIIGAAVQQPWGEIHGSLEGIHYLRDLFPLSRSTHRINAFVEVEYRLFRGFNFYVDAEFSRIKDQFYLSKVGLEPDEILRERRDRETDYRFELSVGLSYRFGSKFANIVNPRMD